MVGHVPRPLLVPVWVLVALPCILSFMLVLVLSRSFLSTGRRLRRWVQRLASELGIVVHVTTAYHPQSQARHSR
jgi:hypothetical protein